MGCRGCGSKKHSSKRTPSNLPLLDENDKVKSPSYAQWKSNVNTLLPPKRKRVSKIKRLEDYQPNVNLNKFKNIQRLEKSINFLKFNPKQRCIFIIEREGGCAACTYMMRMIDKNITHHISAYVVSEKYLQSNQITTDNYPVIIFAYKKKIHHLVNGVFKDIAKIISDFMK